MSSTVRIMEEAGTKHGNILTKADPFKGPCGRDKCMICPGNDKMAGKIYARNMTYTSTCKVCKARGWSASMLVKPADHCWKES